MKVAFYTLGCKVNQYDTQAMRELFERAGHTVVEFGDVADAYIINTCTVTQTGDKKSRQMISRAHALSPEARIAVTGCYAQRAPEEVLQLPGVDLVLGSRDRMRIVELLETAQTKKINAVGGLKEEKTFEEMPVTHEGRTRAHLKIQEGCDRYCTYCVIPYVRGPIRSRSLGDVRAQMEALAAAGYLEVVLTGIHLMSYGKDLGDGTTLLDAIAQADGLPIRRIRLGSLEPQLTGGDLVRALAANRKVCRQFHLSLQSGSAGVLKRMGRRYTPEEYRACVAALRSAMPGCALTTDIIVGFPGETEAEFQETLDFVRELGFARIHVFPYSRREGTAAYAMPGQLTHGEKAKRSAVLSALGKELEQAYLCACVGNTKEVLFEEEENGVWKGYTDTYVHVWAPSAASPAGKILPVALTGVTDGHLNGKIIEDI